jgi:hypothetical protein
MGNSYKKHNITKIKMKGMREISHRKLRKRVKDKLSMGEYDDLPLMSEITPDWDVIDYVSHNDSIEDEEYKNKLKRK